MAILETIDILDRKEQIISANKLDEKIANWLGGIFIGIKEFLVLVLHLLSKITGLSRLIFPPKQDGLSIDPDLKWKQCCLEYRDNSM